MDTLRILAHTQHVARHFLVWRGSLSALAEFVAFSSREPADRIENFLAKSETQRILEAKYETALWRATDKSWRLVCLAINTDPATAKRRLARFPASTCQCRFCLMDEGNLAHIELKPELDIRRQPVPASYLHPQCERPWRLLRDLAEREETTNVG